MVWMMAQTHYLMAAPLPSLVFKKVEFIAVMFKMELQIAFVASREVTKEDVRYNIAELLLGDNCTILLFVIKKLLLILIKFKRIPLTSLLWMPLLSWYDVTRQPGVIDNFVKKNCSIKTQLYWNLHIVENWENTTHPRGGGGWPLVYIGRIGLEYK